MNLHKKLILEGRLEDAKEYFKNEIGDSWPYTEEGSPYHHFLQGVNLEDRFNLFVENDPSPNNKYLKWMINAYLSELHGINPVDVYSAVQKFHTNLDRLTPNFMYNILDVSPKIKKSPKDINSYEYLSELERVVDELENVVTRKEKEKQIKKEKDIIYQDDTWLIIKPKTHQSSCYYGAGTKWCTTAKSDEYFKKYTDRGVLYYVIKKEKTSDNQEFKLAFFKDFPTKYDMNPIPSWYDMEDRRVDNNTVNLITSMLPKEAVDNINKTYSLEVEKQKIDEYITLDELVDVINDDIRSQGGVKFNTESGVWELITLSSGETYLIHNTDLAFKVDFFPSNEYFISVNNLLKDMSSSSMGSFVIHENGIDWSLGDLFSNKALGLPKFTHFKERFLNKKIIKIYSFHRDYPTGVFLGSVLLPNLRTILSTEAIKNLTKQDIKLWKPSRYNTSISFKYPPKKGSLTQMFVDFVKNNPGKTRKEFYDYIGREYRPGNNSEFFATINNAGIVQMERSGRQFVYTLGPNYEAWTEGRLGKI